MLLVNSTLLGFLRVQLPLCEVLPSWASAVFGYHHSGAEQKVVSARLNLRNGKINARRVNNFLGSVSP